MKKTTFMDKYPVWSLELNKSEVKQQSVSEIIEYFKQNIDEHKIAVFIGVFDHYKSKVEEYNCSPININDIEMFVSEVEEKIIQNTLFIDEFHKEEYAKGNLKLPYEGKYSLEQIINEVVPVEVAIKLGENITKACSDKEISDDIKKLFGSKPKKQPKVRTETNLERIVRGDIINEVPDQYREKFQSYIKELGNKNFKFGKEFPYDEFGDEIIKVLYVWNPEDDDKLSKNFAYFTKRFAEVIHTKETILAGNKQEIKETGSWDDIEF